MLLRVSSEASGEKVDVHAVTDGALAAASGVPHGEALIRLAESTVAGSDEELAHARTRVLEELGPAELVDSAAIIGNFERMVRIADATGIPLDDRMNAISADLRAEIGVERFGSSANTPKPSALARFAGRVFRPVVLRMMRLTGRRRPRQER